MMTLSKPKLLTLDVVTILAQLIADDIRVDAVVLKCAFFIFVMVAVSAGTAIARTFAASS
jgi:hypothetical protein